MELGVELELNKSGCRILKDKSESLQEIKSYFVSFCFVSRNDSHILFLLNCHLRYFVFLFYCARAEKVL